MSEVVRAALAAVVEGDTLTLRAGERRDGRGHGRRGDAGAARRRSLVALRMRGETVDELAGFVTRDARAGARGRGAGRRHRHRAARAVTGSGTFNISTAAAIVVAAAGVPVAKHGNRAVTSASGCSDVLDALGVDRRAVARRGGRRRCARTASRSCFAPGFHPACATPARRAGRSACGPRSTSAVRWPTRPASPARRRRGRCRAPRRDGRGPRCAGHRAGVRRPWRGHRRAAARRQRRALRRDAGAASRGRDDQPGVRRPAARASREALAGGDAAENAAIVEAVLRRRRAGPRRDVVAAQRRVPRSWSRGAPAPCGEGVELAAATIDSGAAVDRLERLRARGARRSRPGAAEADTRRGRRIGERIATAVARSRATALPLGSVCWPRSPSAVAWTSRQSSVAAPTARASARGAPRARLREPSWPLLARPGLHLIAEIKRRSPVGRGPGGPEARRRRTGTGLRRRRREHRSPVLVEPHWFGGSLDDLAAIRGGGHRAGAGQGVRRRSPPAAAAACRRAPTSSCCWRRSTAAPACARSCAARARPGAGAARRGARPPRAGSALWPPTRASSGSTTATCERSTSTRSVRSGCGPPCPTTASSSPSPASASRPRCARWRAIGFDAALVGEELMATGDDPAAIRARTAAFVAAGREPTATEDPAAADRAPLVKICGVTDVAGGLAADPGGRRCDRSQPRPGHAAGARRANRAAVIASARPCRGEPAAPDRRRHRRP